MTRHAWSALAVVSVLFVSCGKEQYDIDDTPPGPHVPEFGFSTSERTLKDTFDWAVKTARGYCSNGNDKVGLWYEASLPGRGAFCMRDVSHQVMGAEILGLSAYNLNMMSKFAAGISDSKDWCSYWEIDLHDRPSPVDYRNDKEFWYNLNANFDVLQACLKLYRWTGDRTYIEDASFRNFYERSVEDYVERWSLSPERIMDRPCYMNTPPDFNYGDPFHVCRGLPSYVENFGGMTVSSDLIASLFAGFKAYSEICSLQGNEADAARYMETALKYREILESSWWNAAGNNYYNFYTKSHQYYDGEGDSYILWFNATEDKERIRNTVDYICKTAGGTGWQHWNIETLSYFPKLLYGLGFDEMAEKILLSIPARPRNSYPEASYAVMEGIVGGMMGISADAGRNMVETRSHLTGNIQNVHITDVPMLGGTVSVRHEGQKFTRFRNDTGKDITWKAAFAGEGMKLYFQDGTPLEAHDGEDILGNHYTFVEITVEDGKEISVRSRSN